MQMLRNFVGCDYSTDEGTDSEDEQVSGGEEHVGTGGEIKWIESEKGRPMLVCGGGGSGFTLLGSLSVRPLHVVQASATTTTTTRRRRSMVSSPPSASTTASSIRATARRRCGSVTATTTSAPPTATITAGIRSKWEVASCVTRARSCCEPTHW